MAFIGDICNFLQHLAVCSNLPSSFQTHPYHGKFLAQFSIMSDNLLFWPLSSNSISFLLISVLILFFILANHATSNHLYLCSFMGKLYPVMRVGFGTLIPILIMLMALELGKFVIFKFFTCYFVCG